MGLTVTDASLWTGRAITTDLTSMQDVKLEIQFPNFQSSHKYRATQYKAPIVLDQHRNTYKQVINTLKHT